MREYDQLTVDDFVDLCRGRPIKNSWAFVVRCRVRGMPPVERLAWSAVPAEPLQSRLQNEAARPALIWSVPNPTGYPPWKRAGGESPGGEQMTIIHDRWVVVRSGKVVEFAPSDLASKIVDDIIDKTIPSPTL